MIGMVELNPTSREVYAASISSGIRNATPANQATNQRRTPDSRTRACLVGRRDRSSGGFVLKYTYDFNGTGATHPTWVGPRNASTTNEEVGIRIAREYPT
jgi:hypothetical protein